MKTKIDTIREAHERRADFYWPSTGPNAPKSTEQSVAYELGRQNYMKGVNAVLKDLEAHPQTEDLEAHREELIEMAARFFTEDGVYHPDDNYYIVKRGSLAGDCARIIAGYLMDITPAHSISPSKGGEALPVSDRKPVDHVDVETIALDLTEGIWLRVKGISQHELLSLVKQSIHAGMKLRPKPEPTKE